MAPLISVVIPVRNNAADLPDAVASAVLQPSVHEIVLCVGPSRDDSLQVARQLGLDDGRVVVVENEHGGIPQALNLGLRAATGERLLRLDAHSVLPPDYVENAIETQGATGAANVGAVQRPVGKTLVERAIAAAMSSRAGSGGADYRASEMSKPVDTAFLGFFDIEALRSIGGWDEDFARNEDAELNLRLAAAGHQVWLDPRLVVEYRPRASLRKLASQYFHYGWWRLRTIRKHPGSARMRQMAAPVIVLGVAGAAVGLTITTWALVVPGAYVCAVLVAGLATDGSLIQRLLTGAALGTMHMSWGTGFLLSAARSLFRR